jgi:hypothetical protein
MSTNRTLSELRAEFGRSRFLAMPIAGAVAWSAAGVFGAVLPAQQASIALFFCMPAVFPLGLLFARFITRTVLVVAAWFVFPDHRFVIIPTVIVIIYVISIVALATRPLPSS